jgi:acetoin utilization protein AcuB
MPIAGASREPAGTARAGIALTVALNAKPAALAQRNALKPAPRQRMLLACVLQSPAMHSATAATSSRSCAGEMFVSKPIPTIQKYMTTTPHTIGSEQTIAKAAALMSEHHIRHLPVLHGGRLLGVLSDRDVKLIETFRDVDATKTRVEEAMTEQPYTVDPETPLDQVVRTMAEKKFGSAVVLQNHKVVGIFTTVDACQALSELLQTRLAK